MAGGTTAGQSITRGDLLVEARNLAVQYQRRRRQLANGVRDIREAVSVVASGAAHQPDARAVLVGNDPPAVDLLLVDPAVAVERLSHQRGEHRRDRRDHRAIVASLSRTNFGLPITRAAPGRKPMSDAAIIVPSAQARTRLPYFHVARAAGVEVV